MSNYLAKQQLQHVQQLRNQRTQQEYSAANLSSLSSKDVASNPSQYYNIHTITSSIRNNTHSGARVQKFAVSGILQQSSLTISEPQATENSSRQPSKTESSNMLLVEPPGTSMLKESVAQQESLMSRLRSEF